mgnify:CR=1 FL=1
MMAPIAMPAVVNTTMPPSTPGGSGGKTGIRVGCCHGATAPPQLTQPGVSSAIETRHFAQYMAMESVRYAQAL